MKVYHGSPNKFNQFDYSKIRTNGTSEGVGFYFTDSLDIATGYAQNGYIYIAELNGTKALSDNEKTISRDDLKKLLIELNKSTDCLSNYGDVDFEGLENVLETALDMEYANNTDTEIMGSLYNSNGESEDVLNAFYEVLGYDHIVSAPTWGNQTLYIALTNDIINIVEVKELA